MTHTSVQHAWYLLGLPACLVHQDNRRLVRLKAVGEKSRPKLLPFQKILETPSLELENEVRRHTCSITDILNSKHTLMTMEHSRR